MLQSEVCAHRCLIHIQLDMTSEMSERDYRCVSENVSMLLIFLFTSCAWLLADQFP